jgi:hypothetical protein
MRPTQSQNNRELHNYTNYIYIAFIVQTLLKLWTGWFAFLMYLICAVFFTLALLRKEQWCFLALSISTIPCLLVELWGLMMIIKVKTGGSFWLFSLLTFLNFAFLLYIGYAAFTKYLWFKKM